MKNTAYKFSKSQRIFLAFIFVSVLTGISFLVNHTILAEAGNNRPQIQKNDNAPNGFAAPRDSAPAANIGERTSVWLKLQEGRSPETIFYGKDSAISALESTLAEPLSQVSADFNSDGYADLVGGFRNGAGGGLIIMHRASHEAFAPTDEKTFADLQTGIFPAAFEKDAFVTEVPVAPDFIAAGKFSLDSAVDLVFAARGGRVIYLMTSDGRGGFNQPQEIPVEGEITALASQRLDYSGAYDGIVAAVDDGESASLLVFSSNKDLMNTAPRVVPVESAINSMILAKREPSAAGVELFGLSDGKLFTVADLGSAKNKVNSINLPYRAVDFAVGNFITDRRAKNEIAVLAENGNVNYLADGALDTRPLTEKETAENLKKYGRRPPLVKPDNSPENWTETESYQLGVYAVQNNAPGLLRKAYLTGYETDDLIIVNQQAKQVEVLFKEPNRDDNRTSFTGETKIQTVDFARAPAAILPMRLNVMGQQGFVVYDQQSIEPTAIMLAPNSTYTISKAADTNDGVCNADCSAREAVRAANANAGSDMIMAPNNTYQLTIAGGGEDAAATGDLDIIDAVTIVGTSAAGTIFQAGASTGTGIDKVFSVNPGLTASFATSMSNLTMRYGNNTTDGFGGAMDWDAGNSGGTITLNTVVASNSTVGGGGIGGGGFLFTSANVPGTGSVTITNSTISNNTGAATGAVSVIGGGIYIQYTPFSMTNVAVTGNTSKNNGGGMYIEPVTGSGNAGSSTLTNMTVTGNTTTAANSDGGGIYTLRGLVLTAPTIISNNTATRYGGGIASDVINSSVNLNKATMVGNSAPTSGGAIGVGTITTGNAFNMIYSRIVNNTSTGGFKGLVTRGGTAIVENNWWGCNTGPSAAPCDTAGATAGTLDYDPWLRYTLTASPNPIVVGNSTTLTASFLTNSNNQAIAASNLDVLIGLPITFTNTTPARGALSGAQATIQASGTATATFTASSAGTATITAQVDNGTATANITVGAASTTTTITSDNPDPSVRGQTITVTYTVTVNSPGAGTPTGNVTVSDGVNSCTATVAAGQCSLVLNTVGARTLTATYAGDANFSGSTSAGAAHTVAQAGTTTTITADTPDPSSVNQAVTVTYMVTVTSPGSGMPTGNVTVSDGVNSCTATVAAGQCNITLTTSGMRTLTATYAGDANFSGSTSAGEPHTVNAPTAAVVSVGGRVLTQDGRGISNAVVSLIKSDGAVLNASTNSFGYFRFAGVESGQTYVVSIKHKRYIFDSQAINVNEELTDLIFTANNK